MNLIDIVKLNEEINQMIAKQDEEVKRIDAEIKRKNETLYRAFMDDMEEYSKVAEAIGPMLRVFVGVHDTGWGEKFHYFVRFEPRRHRLRIVSISSRTSLSPLEECTEKSIGYSQPYSEAIAFCNEEVVNNIVKWYFDHPCEFENNLKEECVRLIKDKAEKANKRMLDAEERRRSYESGETK